MAETAPLGIRANPPLHLAPMLCALAAAVTLLGGVQAYVSRRLPGDLPFYAAHAMSFKVNANVLQTLAFRTPGELPIYGSSELDAWVHHRADSFFARRPTGFAVFPVGRGGATCLMIQQKIAAVGAAARGKKVVIFLSPSWFLQPSVNGAEVGANLAMSQLSAWIFGHELSGPLKTAMARRLRDFPASLKNQGLIADAVQCLAEPTPLNRLHFALLYPLGRLQNELLERFDYGVLLWEMVFPQKRWRLNADYEEPPPPMLGSRIDWNRLIARAARDDQPEKAGVASNRGVHTSDSAGHHDDAAPRLPGDHDADFITRLTASKEFADLELLIRVLKELKMNALFISQPIDGVHSDSRGVTPQARSAYYRRLEALLAAAGYPLRDFSEREEDRFFFHNVDHPSAKAWIFFDREIDAFHANDTAPSFRMAR